MRIRCEATVVDVNGRLATSNTAKKPARASVALGKPPRSSAIHIVVCTAVDKTGMSFPLIGNVEKVFDRFIGQGKLTVRLKEPNKDIQISNADPGLLRSFLRSLNAAVKGETVEDVPVGRLQPAKAKHLEKIVTSLTVESRKEYPFSSGFPKTLTSLSLIKCELVKVDQRWLKLSQLQSLDLSNNNLGPVLASLRLNSLVNLRTLKLNANNIADLPDDFVNNLPTLISSIAMKNNSIRKLSNSFIAKFSYVVVADFSDNKIEELGNNIGTLRCLRDLYLQGNKLTSCPASVAKLRIDHADFSDNNFDSSAGWNRTTDQRRQDNAHLEWNLSSMVPPLMQLAGKTILDQKNTNLQTCLPQSMQEFLGNFQRCDVCSLACLPCQSYEDCSSVDVRRISSTAVSRNSSRMDYRIPLTGYWCGLKCRDAYRRWRFCL